MDLKEFTSELHKLILERGHETNITVGICWDEHPTVMFARKGTKTEVCNIEAETLEELLFKIRHFWQEELHAQMQTATNDIAKEMLGQILQTDKVSRARLADKFPQRVLDEALPEAEQKVNGLLIMTNWKWED